MDNDIQQLPPEDKAKAAEYIWGAPSLVQTELRTALEVEPWFHPAKSDAAVESQGRQPAAFSFRRPAEESNLSSLSEASCCNCRQHMAVSVEREHDGGVAQAFSYHVRVMVAQHDN